jgi:diguanylate cyclase (GGDEF)-like protein
LKIPHMGSDVSKYVTISLGVTGTVPLQGQTPEELLVKADKALYQARHTGRNRVSKI